jgi:Protein of unknown function (DUF3147)
MQIEMDVSALKQTGWQQFALRFCLGGLITAATGIIGKKYGPGIGGLFLAFPAIFPASATLIEKHEREKKKHAGLQGETRARQLVAVDAAGTAIGSVGLFLFAVLIAEFIPRGSPWLVISASTVGWTTASVLLWYLRKRM